MVVIPLGFFFSFFASWPGAKEAENQKTSMGTDKNKQTNKHSNKSLLFLTIEPRMGSIREKNFNHHSTPAKHEKNCSTHPSMPNELGA